MPTFNSELVFNLTLNVLVALGIVILGWIIGKWASRLIRGLDVKTHDPHSPIKTFKPVLASLIFYTILLIAIYAALRKVGIEATGLLAVMGAAGIAIALALQGTLSNIAAGIFLLVLRPLKIDEAIETDNFSGTVIEIGLFATKFKTFDGLYMFVPNSQISTKRIINYTRNGTRRLNMSFSIHTKSDIEKARGIIAQTLTSYYEKLDNPSLLATHGAPQAYIQNFEGQAAILKGQIWLPSSNWSEHNSELHSLIHQKFKAAKINLASPYKPLT